MRLALAVALLASLSACGLNLSPAASTNSSVSPSDTTAPFASAVRISEPPLSPAPPVINLPPFACADVAGGKTGVANAIAARVAEQPDYDRFVLQLDSVVPQYTVKRQPSAVFPLGGSGQTITLSGSAGVLVTVHSASGANTFTGPTFFVTTNYQVLKEARQTQDFEGYVSWGLGLSRPACMRVFTLDNPARLVVDLSTTSS